MLSCLLNSQYKEAHKTLNRKLEFLCPECNCAVILKAGGKNIAHFAHKVSFGCKHGEGETLWHRKGKLWVANFYRDKNRGYEIKFEVALGSRRTDVLVTTSEGKKIAVEFQRKDEGATLYKRTNDLLLYVNEVIWVFPWNIKRVDQKNRATATYGVNALYSDKKPVKAKIMFYDNVLDVLLTCRKYAWTSYVEQTDFGGGYDKKSKRWCELVVHKKFENVKTR
ncbi:MAG: competence protein CoiA family protein [Methylococcales bacterium]|nr:competence protein CoiA family protein [Methylococcales bacterium]